jgi:acetyl-CoA carboxylase, biotin carboxylase subunit
VRRIKRVFVANRGEIALRIVTACQELGIETVVGASEVDMHGLAARRADRAVCIGPAPAGQSYLRDDLVVQAALGTRCDAIHPGYGFLSESPKLAARAREHGITFVGPPAEVIELSGDKLRAREEATRAGVPILPGREVASAADATATAEEIGYPLLVKAAAGGGGRGIRTVRDGDELQGALAVAAREAEAAFGDPSLYIEKLVEDARHVEVQVLGGSDGQVLHLFERECSLQRRRQKLVEEAPSPGLSARTREEMTAAAVRLAAAVGYTSAGTVEFLVDRDERFYFIEMNTRLQVEHGVTEMVTGVDLVREQLLAAAGEPLELSQDDVRIDGSAIEFRINAEDPERDFHPSPGRIEVAELPGGPGVRVDTAIYAGYSVVPFYDSLIAKLMVWAPTREQALRRGRRALGELRIEGIATTAPLHLRLVDDDRVRAGDVHTGYLEELLAPRESTEELAGPVSE